MPTLTWIELCLSTAVLLVLGAYVTSIVLHRLRVSSLLSAARASKKAAIQRDVALLAELQQKHSKEIENVDSWLVKHSTTKSSGAPRTPRRSTSNESNPASGSWSAVDLAAAVQQGKLSAVGTLLSFARRAFRAHTDYNCITETMLAAAYAQTVEIDALPAARRRAMSLCGVPVSLKDTLFYEGVDATNGLAALVGQPATEHALIVRLMMQAGAVPFVKSNIPQTLMSFECVNPLHGRSVNPYNKQYTCGGSSGGEGVLLATQSSALGIGTDIGGSIRIPSHFCGIFGLKPTARRFSSYGFRKSPAAAGQQNILACGGPMGRSVDDLAAVARLWLQPEAVLSVDPSCAPVLPFREAEFNDQRPMKVCISSSIIRWVCIWFDLAVACVFASRLVFYRSMTSWFRRRLVSAPWPRLALVCSAMDTHWSIFVRDPSANSCICSTLSSRPTAVSHCSSKCCWKKWSR
jgi:hypothetical protein